MFFFLLLALPGFTLYVEGRESPEETKGSHGDTGFLGGL